jgi:hypothetical protein
LGLLELDLLSDSGILEADEFSFSVVVTVDVSEDLESFLVAAFVPVKCPEEKWSVARKG